MLTWTISLKLQINFTQLFFPYVNCLAIVYYDLI